MKTLPKFMQNLINLKNANSQQLDWLIKQKCEHRHNFVRHFNCFIKEYNIKEKYAFLDIETSNLKADFGIVLCWCIQDEENNIYYDYTTKEDVKKGYEDLRCVDSCIDTMKKFNRVIGHYSTYFDIPFLRTRAMIHGLDFPEYGTIWHTDVWKMAKTKLCLHSNRQDCVAESLQGKTIKTRIDHPSWRLAASGNAKAMEEVVDHCMHDVPDLKENFYSLLPYCKLNKSSI